MKNTPNDAVHHAVLILAFIGLIGSSVLELGTARPALAQATLLPYRRSLVARGQTGFNGSVANKYPTFFILPEIPQDRVSERDDPDLQVVRFSWTRGQSSLIRGAQSPGGPITTPTTNNTDLMSRTAELRDTQRKAAISMDRHGNFYLLHLEVKNTGTRVIKSFAWGYKPAATPDDYEPKEYICLVRAKPSQTKTVNLMSPYAPSKVTSVGVRAEGLKDGEVVINQIEYEDGSIWKRAGWLIELPPDTTKKMASGQCAVF